jgi:hypothetical protein
MAAPVRNILDNVSYVWTEGRTNGALLWRYIARNNKNVRMCNARSPMFLSDFKKIWGFSLHFHTRPPPPSTKFHGNWSMGAVLINSDGQTDMTKAIGSIRDYANGLKRTFLARTRRTSFELQRTLSGRGGGDFRCLWRELHKTRKWTHAGRI